MAEIDAADDALDPGEARSGQTHHVAAELGGVDDGDAPVADELRDARDLRRRVRARHRPAERELDRFQAQVAHLLQERAVAREAGDHGLETFRVRPQALDELSLGAADPEPVEEMEDRDAGHAPASLCTGVHLGEALRRRSSGR